MNLEKESLQLQQLLDLKSPPIAISFRSEPPPCVGRVDAPAPSGCTYWKLAAEGNVFYTEASDHYGCPIGSYTHGLELPPAQAKDLEGMIETMVELNYLRIEEVPSIPRRDEPFGVAIYAPLAKAPVEPDVVIVRGNAKQMMLLAEAANAAGVGNSGGIMGRPTCAMIPAVVTTKQAALSLGCIGNRVYNELGDDELYGAVPASHVQSVVGKLAAVFQANHALKGFHQDRKSISNQQSTGE